MERTYQHIDSEIHVEDAEAAVGVKSSTERRGFTPIDCLCCGSSLDVETVQCSSCGTVYSPQEGVESIRNGGKVIRNGREVDVQKIAYVMIQTPSLRQQLIDELTEHL